MKVLKMALAVLYLFSFISCSRQFQIARVVPGQTYVDEAIDLLDEPDLAERSTLASNQQIFIWRDVTLQVNAHSVVTAVHRKPANHEKTLQFWKQHYQQDQTNFKKLRPNDNTQQSLWLYDVPHKGLSAIYDENTDEVTKVILYETRY